MEPRLARRGEGTGDGGGDGEATGGELSGEEAREEGEGGCRDSGRLDRKREGLMTREETIMGRGGERKKELP